MLLVLVSCGTPEPSIESSSASSLAQQPDFANFKTQIQKHCNVCHGNLNSPYPGIANFAQLQTEDEWIRSGFIVAGDPASSPVYNRLRFSGSGLSNNMPFSQPSIPNTMKEEDAALIKNYISGLNAGEGGGRVITANQSPYSALNKVKTVLQGEALTNAEISHAISSGELQVPALKNLIAAWMNTSAGQQKLKEFFTFVFQQNNSGYQDNWIFGRLLGPRRGSYAPNWEANIEESFSRTALDIVNSNRPFTEVLTTRRHAVTTALLVSYSIADNYRENISFPVSGNIQSSFLNRDEDPRVLIDSDFEDWRMVQLTQAPDKDSPVSWRNIPAIRAVANNANYPLVIPRVGFFNTLAFQIKWLTNEDNQFRLTTNQSLIVGLGKSFEAGDQTPHGNLQALDPSHAPTNTSCYQCHRLMDPMREVFKFGYNFGYRYNFDNFRFLRSAGSPRSPSFAFLGHTAPLNSIDDFGQAIASHPLFAKAWTQKLCSYINSNPCSESDPEFERVAEVFKNSNFNFKTLVAEIFSSSLVVGKLVSLPGGQPQVSTSRSNHFCHSLKSRLEAVKRAKGLTPETDQFCVGAAYESIPRDKMPRAATSFSQTPRLSAFSYKGIEAICNAASLSEVVPGGAFNFANANQIDQSISDMVEFLAGLPSNHPRSARTKVKANEVFQYARSLGINNRNSLREVFKFVCASPDLTGVGL